MHLEKDREFIRIIGWREWVSLPDFGIKFIKVKIDTGAGTSVLHASDIEFSTKNDTMWVRFVVHPEQRSSKNTKCVEAEVIEMRHIRSSSGHVTLRPVIRTHIKIGDKTWEIQLTLINRDIMGFRMLIGREAIRKEYLVNPGRSYLQSHRRKKASSKKVKKTTKKALE